MKILVEILNKITNRQGTFYIVNKSKVIEIDTVINDATKQRAKDKLLELKSTLTTNEKIRVLEYHNDDPDEIRQPCNILFEG